MMISYIHPMQQRLLDLPNLGITSDLDPAERRAIGLVNRIALLGIAVFLLLSLIPTMIFSGIAAVGFDIHSVEPEIGGVRRATRGEEEAFEAFFAAIRGLDDDRGGFRCDVGAVFRHRGAHAFAAFAVLGVTPLLLKKLVQAVRRRRVGYAEVDSESPEAAQRDSHHE